MREPTFIEKALVFLKIIPRREPTVMEMIGGAIQYRQERLRAFTNVMQEMEKEPYKLRDELRKTERQAQQEPTFDGLVSSRTLAYKKENSFNIK